MKFIKKNLDKILLAYIVLSPAISFAEGEVPGPCPLSGKICNPLGATTTIPALIQKILEGALKLGIPIVALAIIYCGFLFVAARGNSEKLTKAKDGLLWTLVGAAILLGAWAIATMIANTITAL